MRDTPRTDAFVGSPEVWHYSGFCDGMDCRIARESTRDFAERLERELNDAMHKLHLARQAITTITHGNPMRDYANKILAETAIDYSSNTEAHGRRSRTVQPLVGKSYGGKSCETCIRKGLDGRCEPCFSCCDCDKWEPKP